MDDAGIAEFDAFDTDWCEQNDRQRAHPGGVRETYYSAGYRAGSNALEASRAECARLRVAAGDVLAVYAPVADHAYAPCFHPTEQGGGNGCHSFASCHGDWPTACKLPYEWHTTNSDDPWLALRAALNGAVDATVGEP